MVNSALTCLAKKKSGGQCEVQESTFSQVIVNMVLLSLSLIFNHFDQVNYTQVVFFSFFVYFNHLIQAVSITEYQLLPTNRRRHYRREEFGKHSKLFSLFLYKYNMLLSSFYFSFQVVVAYNSLGWSRTDIIRIPVSTRSRILHHHTFGCCLNEKNILSNMA